MALPTEESAALFLNIATNVPLNCDFPLYVEEEIVVVYGSQALTAIYNTDYTVQLNTLDGFIDFTVTPLASLLVKINALIASPPTDEAETNFVVVRRKLDYTTDTTPQVVRDTTFLSREIDRMHMKLIQLAERAARSISLPATVVGDLLLEYLIGEPAEGKVPVWRGNKLVAEIDATDVANAQQAAQEVFDARDEVADNTVLAQKWAENPEDVPVVVGQYSAKHWALKALAAAAIALGNLSGLSVLGRSANSVGAMAAITAGSDHAVMRRNGSAIAFGAINLASSAAVSGLLSLLNIGTGVTALGNLGGGTDDITLTAGVRAFTATVTASAQTFTFTGAKATGNEDIFTLRLTNGGSQTVNWPASVDWKGGVAPILTVSGVDELVFKTVDGGTTWVGAAMLDVK